MLPASPTLLQNPRGEHSRRLEALRAMKLQHQYRHYLLGKAKLATAGVAVVLLVLALALRTISILWVLIPALIFVVLIVIHQRVLRALTKYSRTIAFYERRLARLDNCWMECGETGERFLEASHPYARDLDLFGSGSLFELLSPARTRAGEETLAKWLLAPAPPEEVRARQAAVNELSSRLKLREDLAVLGEGFRSGVRPGALAAWGEGKPLLESGWWRFVLAVLAALWLFSLVAWGVWGLGYLVLLTTLVNLSVTYKFRARVKKVVSPVEDALRDLALLAGVLVRFERERFSAPKLAELRSALETEGQPPSYWIARLRRLVEHLESRRNGFVKVIDPFVFWTLQFAFAVEGWRKESGPAIRRWLAALGEMEALAALAGYAYEHPEDVFPDFTEDSPRFEAQGLAHPLLPESRAVRNDLKLGEGLHLMIISGPNMAGKSTFIRSVGLNAVLAQCGSPVRARRLRLSSLTVAASICVLDSLQGGISRFYSEITRLKQMADLTKGPLPVLFLLDELLQGANSHHRRIGAEAISKSLVKQNSVGLITTHDLALTQIADSMGGSALNFHFEDRLENGNLRFDYKLSPGIVRTSNALPLMRSIGLDVSAGVGFIFAAVPFMTSKGQTSRASRIMIDLC